MLYRVGMTSEFPECLVVIPARGGSKGVPNKNLAQVGNIPLVSRSIRSARPLGPSALVVVSTDSHDIAAVARHEGAHVILRPAALSGDEATSESALQHVLEMVSADMEARPRKLIMMQCTSPFTLTVTLRDTIAALDDYDCVITASIDKSFRWCRSSDGRVVGVGHDERKQRQRRQDLGMRWKESGALYGMRTEGFLESGNRFFGEIGIVETPPERTLEIDTSSELRTAQLLAPWLDSEDTDRELFRGIQALAFDIDGVMTENGVIVSPTGEGGALYSGADGIGIEFLRDHGAKLVILTKERGDITTRRGDKAQIPVIGSLDNKGEALGKWAADNGLEMSMIAFVGNDPDDLDVFGKVGLPCCPADAHPLVRQSVRLILCSPGGVGAFGELAERFQRSAAGGGN